MSRSYYFAGIDGAPSEGRDSDDGAVVVVKATPKDPTQITEVRTDWWVDAVYARRLTSAEKASARQWAGLIHQLHGRFRFDRMVLDPGGGGIFIKRELASPRQLIGGAEVDAMPIGDLVDAPGQMVHGHFILHLFKRRDPGIMAIWPDVHGEGSGAGDDSLKDALLSETREALASQYARFPPLIESWSDPALAGEFMRWPVERQEALRNLSLLVNQARNVVVRTNADGTLALTQRGARRFATVGKDDVVYAWMYALCAFWIWLKLADIGRPENADDAVGFHGWEG